MAAQMEEWMDDYGWEQNPFTFRIYPGLMIGYDAAYRRVRDSITSKDKFTLLFGETGAGKTNLLRTVQEELDGDVPVFYMSKPPVTEEGLLAYLRDEVLSPGLWARWRRSYSLHNIDEELNRAFDGQVVLLVDEGHEASETVLEWMRTAIDHVDGLTVVAAGLPRFEDQLREQVGTLHNRATETVRLASLDRDHTIELIRERIEHVGGSGTEPFTQDALLAVYEATGGFPREVLRLCGECVTTAAAEEKAIIDERDVKEAADAVDADAADESSDDVNSEDEGSREDTEADLRRLTPKQDMVYEAVEALGEATSGEVVDHLDMEEDYKSREHAIRSVNNILRRLMEEDVVSRERRGRTYLYEVAE